MRDKPRLLRYLLNCVPAQEGGPETELRLDEGWTVELEEALSVFAGGRPPRSLEETAMRRLLAYHPLLGSRAGRETAFVRDVARPSWDERTPVIRDRASRFALGTGVSAVSGYGVFAHEGIPPHRKVIEFTGERVDLREAERRQARARIELLQYDPNRFVDPAFGGSGAEWINHSCDPNLFMRLQQGHVLLMSRRTIAAGEELFYDYRFGGTGTRIECRCGSPRCRGYI